MYNIYNFYEMALLDDASLHWCKFFHASIIWHCFDTGFNDILCKCNRGLVLFAEGNPQPYHNFLVFLTFQVHNCLIHFMKFWVFLALGFSIFFLYFWTFLGTFFFFDNLFNFLSFLGICIFYIPAARFIYLTFWYVIFGVGFSRYFCFLYCFINSFLSWYIFVTACFFSCGS